MMRRRNPEAAARVVLIHGAGGHSAALWPIASLISPEQVELAAVDLPLYGETTTADPSAVRYGDWVDLLCDLVDAEKDGRPLILLGASLGGMLAYEAAARTGLASAVIATCLLDPRAVTARVVMTRFGPFGALGGLLSHLPLGIAADQRIPMAWVAALSKMSRDPELSQLCAEDIRGGGVRVPIGFLASYMTYRHTPPEQMRTPVTLTHPAMDSWTPAEVSVRWLRRIAAPAELVMLRECGHFPIEEPGLTELIRTVERIAAELD